MKGAANPGIDGRDFVRRMHAVAADPRLRMHAVARALLRLDPEAMAQLLGEVLRFGRSGDEAANCVLGAVMAVLEDRELGCGLLESLAAVPPERIAGEVATLLATGPARRVLDEDAARADARNFTETLGLLKTRARTVRDLDSIARIALASNPSVVRNLLVNPRLTEATVVRLAARRPARAEPLVEVSRSRWGQRRPVRRALVLNPYLPPEVGVKLVPLLLQQDWEEIAEDRGLHPSVRAAARTLLARPSGDMAEPPVQRPIEIDPDD